MPIFSHDKLDVKCRDGDLPVLRVEFNRAVRLRPVQNDPDFAFIIPFRNAYRFSDVHIFPISISNLIHIRSC